MTDKTDTEFLQDLQLQVVSRLTASLGDELIRQLQGDVAYLLAALDNADCRIRQAALEIGIDALARNSQFVDKCMTIALLDPDPGCRTLALIAIRSYYRRSKREKIVRFFASIVKNKSETELVRSTAYFGMCHCYMPFDKWPTTLSFEFNRDVDWCFVNRW